MDASGFSDIFKVIAALTFVLALMGGLTLILKKLGLSGALPVRNGEKRLKIVEILPLDGRRKLVLIQRDNTQHLLVLGGNDECVVETGITPPDNTKDG